MQAHCGDPAVEAQLEARIQEAVASFERRPQEIAQLCLAFYEPRRRQAGWLGKADERLYWEKWCVIYCQQTVNV
jgi:Autophagy-related protein 101